MPTDTIIFHYNGKPSFLDDADRHGTKYCKHCKAWHARTQLSSGVEFCAFCNTTHHSRACGAGLRERCPEPKTDPIHAFLQSACLSQKKLDLAFCSECNCHHSAEGWRLCLSQNKPKASWSEERKIVWKLRWKAFSTKKQSTFRTERSLFDRSELGRIQPYEYPLSSSKFEHHRNA